MDLNNLGVPKSMMDNFKEEVVVRRRPGLYNLTYVFCWIIMILSIIMAVIGLENVLMSVMEGQFQLPTLIITLITGGIAFLCFRYKDDLKVEYEYTFTNGDLDVARVLNNSKRRYLTSLNMKNVDAAGAVNTPAFQRFASMNDIKKHNWFLNRDANLYYYLFTKNQVRHMIILELSDEMVELTKKGNYMNFGVWQK